MPRHGRETPLGITFSPSGAAGRQGQGETGRTTPIQRAIQTLSLRLPEVISGRSLAPAPLLRGGAIPDQRVSAVLASLLQQMAANPQADSSPALQVPAPVAAAQVSPLAPPTPTVAPPTALPQPAVPPPVSPQTVSPPPVSPPPVAAPTFTPPPLAPVVMARPAPVAPPPVATRVPVAAPVAPPPVAPPTPVAAPAVSPVAQQQRDDPAELSRRMGELTQAPISSPRFRFMRRPQPGLAEALLALSQILQRR